MKYAEELQFWATIIECAKRENFFRTWKGQDQKGKIQSSGQRLNLFSMQHGESLHDIFYLKIHIRVKT